MEATKYSKEDIQTQMNDTKTEVQKTLEEYDAPAIRDFTPQEEEDIRKGKISAEEAIAKIVEESGVSLDTSSTSSEQIEENKNNGNDVSSSSSQSSEKAEIDKSTSNKNEESVPSNTESVSSIVGRYTIELYTLKASYLGQIGNLIDEAKVAHKNGTSASALVSQYMGRLASLEREADSAVDGKIGELRNKLTSMGADTSICDTMKSSYEKEKRLKKAYYLSLYNEKSKK